MFTTMIALAAASALPQTTSPTAISPPATPRDALSAWVAQVDRQIDANLVSPDLNESGVATVSFRRGANGRAVQITARSGNPYVLRAAIQTIKLAGVLPPMPASMPSDQRISFRFLVGMVGHQDEFYAARKTLVAAETQSNVTLAAQLASKVQVADQPAPRVELAAVERR